MGAGLGVGNLWAWAQIVVRLLPEDASHASEQTPLAWALVAALKVVAVAGVAWLLIRHGLGSPLPMLIGLASLPIGIAIAPLVSHTRSPPEDR
jgi:hypothetical protein